MYKNVFTYTSNGTVFLMYLPVMFTFLTFTSLPITNFLPLSTSVAPYIDAEYYDLLYVSRDGIPNAAAHLQNLIK